MPEGSSDVACAWPPFWSTAPVTSSLACSTAGSSVMLIAMPPVGLLRVPSVYDARGSGRGDRLQHVQPGRPPCGQGGGEHAGQRGDDQDLEQAAVRQAELRHAL